MNKIQRLLRELDIKIEAYEDVLKEDRYIDWEDYHWAKKTKAWLTMPRDEIEDQTIDIENILQLNGSSSTADHTTKINQLIEAVKHLNKEIQSIKKKE